MKAYTDFVVELLSLRIVDQLQFGPFATEYHLSLVNVDFVNALEQFLVSNLLPQADAVVQCAAGKVTAIVHDDYYCGPTSLVRDIFTLDVVLHSGFGSSELTSDIVYHPAARVFTSRPGERGRMLLWTPARKAAKLAESKAIDDLDRVIRQGPPFPSKCPMCGLAVSIVEQFPYLTVHCPETGCFKYVYARGRWVQKRFFTKQQ